VGDTGSPTEAVRKDAGQQNEDRVPVVRWANAISCDRVLTTTICRPPFP
jgi:hypothetical protein